MTTNQGVPRLLLSLVLIAQPAQRADALRIVVLEGEGAINIIQQKTAVAPMVEVRDRNNQPVAGAVVRFAITKGRATFAGARTLTVATDAAGRAAVTSFVPSGSGALQISATAAFQGQTAAITIAQTNVLTAAEAAAASGAAGGTSSGSAAGSSGGGGAGGGGLSTTTLVITGAAVAGGALAATKIVDAADGDKYAGPLNFQMTETYGNCNAVYSFTSEMRMSLHVDGTSANGHVNWSGRRDFVSTTCSNFGGTAAINDFGWGAFSPAVGGTTGSLTFHHEVSDRTDPKNFTCSNCGEIWDFTGALSDTTITGAADFSQIGGGAITGRVRIPVRLTRQ